MRKTKNVNGYDIRLEKNGQKETWYCCIFIDNILVFDCFDPKRADKVFEQTCEIQSYAIPK